MSDTPNLPPGAVLRPINGQTATPAAATSAAPASVPGLPPGAEIRPLGTSTQDDNSKDVPASDVPAVLSPFLGLEKEAERTAHGIGSMIVPDALLRKLGVSDEHIQNSNAHEAAATELHGIGEHIGGAFESLVEFMGGEEALKGLSLADKLRKVSSVAKFMESYPRIAKALGIAVQQGAVGAAQAEAKGDEHPLVTGAVAGVTGATLSAAGEGIGKVISKVKPKSVEIAGEKIPQLASQEVGAPKIAGEAASIATEPEIATKQQQGGKKVIANVAQGAARRALAKFQAIEPELQVEAQKTVAPAVTDSAEIERELAATNAQKKIGSQAATLPSSVAAGGNKLVDEVGTQAATIPDSVLGEKTGRSLTARQVKTPFGIDAEAAANRVHSFGDAADEVKKAATPVFEKLNSLSDGEFTSLQNKVRSLGRELYKDPGNEDVAKQLREAEGGIERIFGDHAGDIDRKDLANARSAWRDQKVLQRIHDAVDGAFDGIPESVSNRTGINRGLSGDRLQVRLGAALKKISQPEIERVIGADGLDNLYRVARLLQTPERAKEFGNLAGAVIHAAGPKGLWGLTAGEAKRALLHAAATSPKIAERMEYALNNKVPPRVAAGLIAHLIRTDQQ